MIKQVTCILVALLMFATASITAFSAEKNGYLRGDANGDGNVSIMDVTIIQRRLANIPVSSFDEIAADINNNGLDVNNPTKIQRYLAKFNNVYHINEWVDNVSPSRDQYELPFIPS